MLCILFVCLRASNIWRWNAGARGPTPQRKVSIKPTGIPNFGLTRPAPAHKFLSLDGPRTLSMARVGSKSAPGVLISELRWQVKQELYRHRSSRRNWKPCIQENRSTNSSVKGNYIMPSRCTELVWAPERDVFFVPYHYNYYMEKQCMHCKLFASNSSHVLKIKKWLTVYDADIGTHLFINTRRF